METLRDLEVVRDVGTVVRAAAADEESAPRTMEVRFSPFGEWYEIDSMFEGRFLERTVPGAFKRAIDRGLPDVKVLFNHGFDPQVGDKPLGPIRSLTEEGDSPVGIVELLDTSYNRDLIPGLEAGVYGSSFRFRVVQEEWDDMPRRSERNPDGIPERTIKEVRLYEFGPVTFPANPAATAAVRSATDSYYERLRARDPQGVAELEERAKRLRPPTEAPAAEPPATEGPADTPPSDPASRYSHGHRSRYLRELDHPTLKGQANA